MFTKLEAFENALRQYEHTKTEVFENAPIFKNGFHKKWINVNGPKAFQAKVKN